MDDRRVADEAGSAGLGTPDSSGEAEARAAKPRVPLRLLLQPHGLVVELNRSETVVGRHHEANLRLPLPDVSRRHCRILFVDGAWQVCDLNSLNGVYVNDERVQQAVLRHHDMVRIGGFLFQVDLHSGEATVAMSPSAQEQVIKSIADILPAPAPPPEQLNRKAS